MSGATPLAPGGLPSLIVTVDTEGDNLWARAETVTTTNARHLPRFHEVCRRFGLPVVYLTTFEMAACPVFQSFARAVLSEGDAEVGMHLHAWNSPPRVPLGDRDHWRQPFVTAYPTPIIREKMTTLTRYLEDTFQVPIRSHRGGRWAFDARCARILAELGYHVDSSVTPHVDWRRVAGGRVDATAPNYTGFPEVPYWLDLDDVAAPGDSRLLEVPMTTCRVSFDVDVPNRADAPFFVRWLRPNGRNLTALRSLVARSIDAGRPCLVLMLHSSELMPGGSPTCPRAEDVEALYRDLEALFSDISSRVHGATLRGFHRTWSARLTSPAGFGA